MLDEKIYRKLKPDEIINFERDFELRHIQYMNPIAPMLKKHFICGNRIIYRVIKNDEFITNEAKEIFDNFVPEKIESKQYGYCKEAGDAYSEYLATKVRELRTIDYGNTLDM